MYPSLTRNGGGLFPNLESLQRQVEHLLAEPGWPSSIRAAARGAFPAINMGSTADALEVYAFAPGIELGKLEVSVDRGLLTIAGERAPELPEPSERLTIFAAERFSGPFKRVISLPPEADASRVEAKYQDGVVRIVVPKQETTKPRRVEVKDSR